MASTTKERNHNPRGPAAKQFDRFGGQHEWLFGAASEPPLSAVITGWE